MHVASCSCLDDRTFARVHQNRNHAFFLIVDPQSQRPDSGFAAPTLIGVTVNAMAHRPAFGLQRPAFQDFLDAPVASQSRNAPAEKGLPMTVCNGKPDIVNTPKT
jgi:hypothetical protein